MKIEVELHAVEVNGTEPEIDDRPRVTVEAHWNDDDLVVIKIGSGKRYTINADELVAAIERTTGWR